MSRWDLYELEEDKPEPVIIKAILPNMPDYCTTCQSYLTRCKEVEGAIVWYCKCDEDGPKYDIPHYNFL